MSSQCELNNPEYLATILATLYQNPKCTKDVFNRFPFDALLDVSTFESNLIIQLVQVLDRFVQGFDLVFDQERIQSVCNFYANYLKLDKIIKLNDSSIQMLIKGLTLTNIRRSTPGYVMPNVLKSINAILESGAFNLDTKKTVIVFVRCLMSENDLLEDDDCVKCITNIWNLPMLEWDRFKFAKSLICHTYSEAIPYRAEANRLVMDSLEECIPNKTEEIITDLAYIYKECKDQQFRGELTLKLLRKNFASSLDRNRYLNELIEIFYHQVSILFEETPWNGDLKQEIRHSLQSRPTGEYYFINAYIELVYHNITHDPKRMISKIVRTYGDSIPANPAVLKSVCALFPAYIRASRWDTSQTANLEADLISAILPKNITLYPKQLRWIFAKGNKTLQHQALRYWINNYDDAKILAKIIAKMHREKYLVDALNLLPTEDGKRRVLRLLSLMPSSKKDSISIYLMNLIYKIPNLPLMTVEAIMEAKPARYSKIPDSIDRGLLRVRFMSIISKYQPDLMAKNNLKMQLYRYLYQMTVHDNLEPDNRMFVSAEMVNMLLLEIENTTDNLHLLTRSMLRNVLILQARFNIVIQEQLPFTCSILDENDENEVKVTLQIFEELASMADRGMKPIIALLENDCPLTLYSSLLNMINTPNAQGVVKSLIYMFRNNQLCAESFLNFCAIENYAAKRLNNIYFLEYLTEWYYYIKGSSATMIPLQEIIKYIFYLNSMGISTELDDLTVDSSFTV